MKCTNKKRSLIMKLNKVLCLFLMLTVVLSLASCDLIMNSPVGDLIEKLPFVDAEYTVEFDTDGGSKVESVSVVEGDPVKAPADPTKEGYEFLGWYNGDAEWDFETPVTEDIVLTAKWEKLPEPCAHVDADDDGKCDKCGEAYDDGTDVFSHLIIYMDGNKKLDLSPSSFDKNSEGLTLPTPAAKAGYEFTGWYSDPALTSKVTSINVNANSNIVLFAGYAPVSYKITYELDGGVNAESNPASYTVASIPASLAAPAKEGYEFKGWYTDANCTEEFAGFSAENLANVVVYAKWEKLAEIYNIYFLDPDHNIIESLTSTYESVDYDQPITQVYELEGFVFLGWNHDKLGTPVSVIPANSTGDIRLVANMQADVVTHKVNYYINGTLYHTANFPEDTGLETLLDGSAPGFKFNGWYLTPNFKGDVVTSIAAGTTTDVNLFGSHTVQTYTIKFFDGETELDYELKFYEISDTDIELPAIPEKVGASAKGWYDADGNKYTCIAAGTYGDLVLYATYESFVYTVTYYLDGTETYVAEYSYDNLPTLYYPDVREGFLFAGWYADAALTEGLEDLTKYPNQDISLYAKWVAADVDDNLTPEVPF